VLDHDDSFRWDKIWRLKVPNKVKMFLWRIAHNSLVVKRNVARRGVDSETICPMCYRLDEDCVHLFLKCKGAKECWRLLNLEEYHIPFLGCASGKEVIQQMWTLPAQVQLKIIVFLWKWWSVRNKANAGAKTIIGYEVCSIVDFYVQDFEKLKKKTSMTPQARGATWEPPPDGFYKSNIDVVFTYATSTGGWGFVARDNEGEYMEGGCGNLLRVSSPLQG
jgi:hypothetical protein